MVLGAFLVRWLGSILDEVADCGLAGRVAADLRCAEGAGEDFLEDPSRSTFFGTIIQELAADLHLRQLMLHRALQGELLQFGSHRRPQNSPPHPADQMPFPFLDWYSRPSPRRFASHIVPPVFEPWISPTACAYWLRESRPFVLLSHFPLRLRAHGQGGRGRCSPRRLRGVAGGLRGETRGGNPRGALGCGRGCEVYPSVGAIG